MQQCVAQTHCDESGSACEGLRWTDSRKARLCLEPACEARAIPISCEEARTAILKRVRVSGSEDPDIDEIPQTQKKRVSFGLNNNEVREFYRDYSVTGNDVPDVFPAPQVARVVRGVDWPSLRLLLAKLKDRMNIAGTAIYMVFPGFYKCLGESSKVTVSVNGYAVPIYFDRNAITRTELFSSSKSIRSLSGEFTLWKAENPSIARRSKAAGIALNGLDGFGIRVFDLRAYMSEPGCEPWLMLEETRGSEFLGTPAESANPLPLEIVRAATVRVLEILKTLHSRGLVHLNLLNSLYWDGSNVESIKLAEYGSVQFFVDPAGAHVSVDNCKSDRNNSFLTIRRPRPYNCVSRHIDYEDMVTLLDRLGNRVVETSLPHDAPRRVHFLRLGRLVRESTLVGFTETIDYDEWISLFLSP